MRLLVSFIIVVLAALLLAHRTYVLTFDPYTRIYRVEFQVVRGLDNKSKVLARGVSVGRVDGLELNDARGTVVVTMRVLPGLIIARSNSNLRVVSANAFGRQNIEVDPGIPTSEGDLYGPADIIDGEDPEASPFMERLKNRDPFVNELFDDFLRQSRSLVEAEGAFGRLLGDPDLASGSGEAIANLRAQIHNLERSLEATRNAENGPGALLTNDPEPREQLIDTLKGLSDTLKGLRDRLDITNRDEDSLGPLISDPVTGEDWRINLASARDATGGLADDEGLLRRPGVGDGVIASSEGFAEGMRNLNSGDSAASRLFKDRGSAASLRETLERLRATTREISEGEGDAARYLTDIETRDRLEEVLLRIRRTVREVEDGVHRGIAAQPVNTVHGAVFSIF